MRNIDFKYDVWQNKLLDLGKRNRLLNYKDTAKSNVTIEYPNCRSLWNMFVKDEIPLVFPFENEDDDGEKVEFKCNVTTNKTTSELQKALRYLRSRARTVIEEQGINVLYLSFGFLNWTDSENSEQVLKAPLVLVPVCLTVTSINSPYVLSLHEDEIILNPTLIYKMENDFGISLPSFEDIDDIGVFFDEVRQRTAFKNWSVGEEVGLSLLSFLKINMYADLKNHKDAIIANPIIRAISGDLTDISKVPSDISRFDFDKDEKPIDVFQVVDADASQQEAILMAKRGVSFVLQGPPGTGKSQTITNIIAESLAEGKKVLFVSEKMAALDVVHRRLASAGLDDFCLVLHSHKANKKNVLNQLNNVFTLSSQKATLKDEAYHKLDVLQIDKEKLNEYVKELHEVIEPLGKSIYEANGIIANLDTYDDFIFSIENIREVTKEQFGRYAYLLSRFEATVGKMSDDYKSNPWRGCKLSGVSNEFRHDAASKLRILLPKIEDLDREFAKITDELNLNVPRTLVGLKNTIELLDCLNEAYVVPAEWLLTNDIQVLYEEANRCAGIKSYILSLVDELTVFYDKILSNEPIVPISDADRLGSESLLEKEGEALKKFISTKSPYCCWSENKLDKIVNILKTAEDNARRINSVKNDLLRIYEPTVFSLDYRPILQRIKTEYRTFTKFFKKTYRQDKKSIMSHHREIVKKVTDEEMLSLVEKLKRIDDDKQWYREKADELNRLFGEGGLSENSDYSALNKQIETFNAIIGSIEIIDKMIIEFKKVKEREDLLRDYYKFLYKGILSDWDLIRKSLDWAVLFKNTIGQIDVSEVFIKSVCCGGEFVRTCKNKKKKLEELTNNTSFEYVWFVSNFESRSVFDNLAFADLQKRLNDCFNGLFLLEEWIDYRSARENCVKGGLADFIRVVEEYNVPVQKIGFIFKKRFFRLWLDAVLPEYPAIMNFRRKAQEGTIGEFSSLDKDQFEIAKARIRGKLVNELPSFEHFTSSLDEVGILKRELRKQRRIMPIRRLFKAIPNLLLTLKPCLMMSPLSVSLFLEADTYKFDIVIFDEASQVCTENAIGAISRAKQVVIAGDSKQLPPTNFFQAALSDGDFDASEDDEEEEYDDSGAYESILDEANMLPECTLRWHYRSKHESLIEFSNAKIYNNNLITFPSNMERSTNNGVEYVHVANGFYDRGGKRGNVAEAEKVADLVFRHFREQPNRSLGVIAFGEVQQQAIETAIRKRRLKDQTFEAFFAEDMEESFFIKNLENVQGDERDTIIFSIGYAKDKADVFRMNFGPLSKSGGERRLNVAITRAKYNIKLVGSIMPTDIDINKINSIGPRLLKDYIDFAINGSLSMGKSTTENDIVDYNFFEEAVYNFLNKKGYKVGTKIGCSGYRLDMAVKHPKFSDVYVLGIECDGMSYRSARTARERDRLRKEVLEKMGWTIYRIWSTDWIKDPITEGSKLVNAIDTAILNYCSVDESEAKKRKSFIQRKSTNELLNFEEKNLSVDLSDNPYKFAEVQKADFSTLLRNKNGMLKVTDCIIELVNKEYPVHYDMLCQAIAPLFGNEKATIKIRREVDYGLRKLADKVVRKGDFLFPIGYQTVPVRIPNDRKIQYISLDELAEAMYVILKTFVGATREVLIAEAVRVYGFNRAGQNIIASMSEAVDILVNSGKVEEVEGKLRIKK